MTEPGVINVDFAHIRQMMKLGGGALMAIGQGDGDKKAMNAIHQALNHPLLESVSLNQAAGIIANFTGGQDLTLFDVGEALAHIQTTAGGDVDVVMGFNNDNRLGDRAQVILVITGLGAPSMEDVIGKRDDRPFVVQPSAIPRAVSPDDETHPVSIPLAPPAMMATAASDLDMPAFMRRRERYSTES